ncbi:MAG TPA: hypothetical protein VG733_06735 [Chthoniobacteraceae bacterium]|nr:hypothetical protein [Chthoniobacteraceae bacterium]
MKRLFWLIPVLLPLGGLFTPYIAQLPALLIFAGFCCLVSAFGLLWGVVKHPATWVVFSLFLAVGLFFMDIGMGFFLGCVYPGIK